MGRWKVVFLVKVFLAPPFHEWSGPDRAGPFCAVATDVRARPPRPRPAVNAATRNERTVHHRLVHRPKVLMSMSRSPGCERELRSAFPYAVGVSSETPGPMPRGMKPDAEAVRN